MATEIELYEEEKLLQPPKGEWLISTWDNPWNPFDHEREWMSFDESNGYCTNGLVARLMDVNGYTSDFTYFPEDSEEDVSRVMRKIVTQFPSIWRFVEKGKKPEVRKLDANDEE